MNSPSLFDLRLRARPNRSLRRIRIWSQVACYFERLAVEKPWWFHHGKMLCKLLADQYLFVFTGGQLIHGVILAVSCPYSRAEHIPCQNGWEISGNRADPVQVIFLFRTVCQVFLFFWHVRCRLHVFFPREDPSFEQFLMMAFSWKWSLIRTFRTN